MSTDKRDDNPGGDALENEFRSMFAERSETVRVATAPYAAVRQRLAEARRKRRMRIGSAGVAFAVAVVGVGVWAAVPGRDHSAVSPGSSTGANTANVQFVYSDGHEITDPSLRDAALKWLEANYTGKLSGLTVVTTFDRTIQAAMPDSPTSGIAVVDSRNGAVLALAGAWQRQLQMGDLMKPVVLAAAFKDSAYNPDSKVPLDAQKHPLVWPLGARQAMTFETVTGLVRNWPPESPTTNIQNVDVTLRQAAELGANEPFAQLELAPSLGPDAVSQMGSDLGMPKNTPDLFPVPAVALGTPEVTPLTMAEVYATLDSGGVRHEPRMVSEVVGSAGKVVWTAPDKATTVLPPAAAKQVTDILHSALMNGTTGTYTGARTGAGPSTWAMAAATDTEQAAWFDGADSHYVVAVGLSKTNDKGALVPLAGDKHGGPDVGSRLAGPIWANLVQTLRKHG